MKIPQLRLLVVAALVVALDSQAGVRVDNVYSPYIHANVTMPLFLPGGGFMIGGGVFLEGSAVFLLEENGTSSRISDKAVGLEFDSPGSIYLSYGQAKYRLELQRGLACPLGRFVLRGGRLLATLPPEPNAKRLSDAGVVPVTPKSLPAALKAHPFSRALHGMFVAKEFKNTSFETLAVQADFSETGPLPPSLRSEIIRSVNNYISTAYGSKGTTSENGSYVNTDRQVTYRVFLVKERKEADISGVPLRYSWITTDGKPPIIDDVVALSQEWPDGTHVSDPTAQPTQYDVISLYQASGVMRQLSASRPDHFKNFVSRVCASPVD
jgi:hypothetical protein